VLPGHVLPVAHGEQLHNRYSSNKQKHVRTQCRRALFRLRFFQRFSVPGDHHGGDRHGAWRCGFLKIQSPSSAKRGSCVDSKLLPLSQDSGYDQSGPVWTSLTATH
jgi:hypothetical protein